jgi:hypothetical protein
MLASLAKAKGERLLFQRPELGKVVTWVDAGQVAGPFGGTLFGKPKF